MAILVSALAIAFPGPVFEIAHVIGWCLFAALAALRLIAAVASLAPQTSASKPLERDVTYTIICPLFREANQVGPLLASLARLDFPKDRLQIILALEADDIETAAAVRAVQGVHVDFEVALVPAAAPRTKPKALNFALAQARGDFVAIYDAEDRPDPAQLRAASAAFAAGDDRLGVVQAPLRIDNGRASWIAAQFSAEYAVQFGQILPLFARLGLPFPLGGTSNHFRRAALIDADGWDAFNVTEDADLGYRLARLGWTSAMIAPPTWEEAPMGFSAWLRQRTRWIKGHLQTWLVLTRDPGATWRDLGGGGFLAMLAILGGGLLAALVHGPLALALLGAAAAPHWNLSTADWVLAGIGYLAASAAVVIAAARLRDSGIAWAALTMPLYWPLASLAALWALVELAFAPFYWAKTTHGLCQREDQGQPRACHFH